MESGALQPQSKPEKRLTLPAYHVKDAARFAGVSVGTIGNWQRAQRNFVPALAAREEGFSLSFLQLVELRFVAAMREAGIKLKAIRAAREYLAKAFETEFPFADIRLKHNAQNIIVDLEESEGATFRDVVLIADKGGQYSWKDIIGRKFQEFEYVDTIARRWHVAGRKSPIVIDPHIAFGAPQVKGIPTWVIKNRFVGGESLGEISADFGLTQKHVKAALNFEKSSNEKKNVQRKAWTTH